MSFSLTCVHTLSVMSGSLGFKAEGVLSVTFLLVGTLISGVDSFSFSDGTVFIILIIRKGSLIPSFI